ncbi:MAG: hypothetical protein CL920_32020 [Deltaproteobacteria bacterium]|nr:hypothetical protein [Deltaproteobacteria bacterium]MBU53348.1 hypothetical protein [Deltaproteobacteria bacterium]|tara:strand:- start:332 stop:1012 length:681 start_codon:yes stop_codon:yes gene_type:complete
MKKNERLYFSPKIDKFPPQKLSLDKPPALSREMQELTGKKYTSEEIWNAYCESMGETPSSYTQTQESAIIMEKCQSVHAWPIPKLKGLTFKAENSSDLLLKTPSFLREQIGQFEGEKYWHIDFDPDKLEPEEIPLAKYGILHTCVPFGFDQVTNTPLSIEIYGHIVFADNKYLRTSEERFMFWFENYLSRLENIDRPVLPVPLNVQIQEATLSNIYAPFIGMTFYM